MSRADRQARAGFVRSLGREIVDPDISAEELGQALLVLERLVTSGALELEAADALLAERCR